MDTPIRQAVLQVEGLNIYYGAFQAVRDMSLTGKGRRDL